MTHDTAAGGTDRTASGATSPDHESATSENAPGDSRLTRAEQQETWASTPEEIRKHAQGHKPSELKHLKRRW